MDRLPVPASAAEFWKRFECAFGADALSRFYGASHFDDNEQSANALTKLVLAGRKRATTGLVWAFECDGIPMPVVGDLSVITDWVGVPQCVIETKALAILPFNKVDEEFAAEEGEGDGSLSHWRQVHWVYFVKECSRIGKEPSERMLVLCELFEVVYSELHRGAVDLSVSETSSRRGRRDGGPSTRFHVARE